MNKEKLILYSYLLLGFSIITHISYIRLIVVRLPKELYIYDLQHNINLRVVLLIFGGLIIATFKIISSIMILYKVTGKTSLFTKLGKTITEIIANALFEVYNAIVEKIPDAYDKLSAISKKFYQTFSLISETFFIVIDYIVRSVILLFFIIDVFIYFRLDLMYKALYLLIISILIKGFFYMLRDIASNLETLENDLIITDKGIDSYTGLPKTAYRFRDVNETADLNYHINEYIFCSKLTGYLNNYDRFSRYLQPLFSLVLYSLYFFTWSYIVYINIITYFL